MFAGLDAPNSMIAALQLVVGSLGRSVECFADVDCSSGQCV